MMGYPWCKAQSGIGDLITRLQKYTSKIEILFGATDTEEFVWVRTDKYTRNGRIVTEALSECWKAYAE